MKLIIDIPEVVYNNLKNLVDISPGMATDVDKAIAKGIPTYEHWTNGEMMLYNFFKDIDNMYEYYIDGKGYIDVEIGDVNTTFDLNWWNARYIKEIFE